MTAAQKAHADRRTSSPTFRRFLLALFTQSEFLPRRNEVKQWLCGTLADAKLGVVRSGGFTSSLTVSGAKLLFTQSGMDTAQDGDAFKAAMLAVLERTATDAHYALGPVSFSYVSDPTNIPNLMFVTHQSGPGMLTFTDVTHLAGKPVQAIPA